ncbi:MAG: hypothetical protein J6W35_03380 [Eubacterium sp.]|nr:hypothetical protein [Eubacterium sp.]
MKKLLGLVLVMAMIVGLCGCTIVNETNTISDKIINQVMTYDIKKQVVDDYMKDPNIDTEQRMYLMQLVSAMSIVKIDGENYYRYRESSNETFKEYMVDRVDNDSISYVTKDTFYENSDRDNVFGGMALGYSENGQIPIDYSQVKYTLTLTFANNVVNTNGKIDETNPKKVSFDLDFSKNKLITTFATTNKNNTMSSVLQYVKGTRAIGQTKIKKITANKVKKKAKTASVTIKLKKAKNATRYVVEYSTKKKIDPESYLTDSKTSKKTTIKIKGLKKNKKYYFRAYPKKIDYTGDYYSGITTKVKSIKTKKYKKSKKK